MILDQSFEDSDWQINFRMGRRRFDFLCQEQHPFLEKEDTVFRQAVNVRKCVAVALWRLATNADYWTICHLFSISTASVCLILDEF